MKKKKLVSIVAGVAVVATLAVGSLAWFTSSDSVTNAFSTGSTVSNDVNAGIEISEDFDGEKAKNILPGDDVKKLVKIDSTAKYDQLVRAKISKVFKDKDGNVVDCYTTTKKAGQDGDEENIIKFYNSKNAPEGAIKLNEDFIQLDLSKNGKWTSVQQDGYYYYNEILPGEQATAPILDSVTLSKDADNCYKNLNFDVVVEAESIQASNDAVTDAWKGAPASVSNLGK